MRAVFSLAYAGVLDYVRSKIFAVIVAAGAALVCGALLAQELAGSEGSRVLADSGLAFIALTSDVLAGVLSVVTVAREIETRQAHLLLSRPISRMAYVAGRFLSLTVLIVVTNMVLGLLLGVLLMFEGSPEWSVPAFAAATFCSLESFIVASIGVLLGVGSSTAVSAIYLFLVVILGRLISDLEQVIATELGGISQTIASLTASVLPALDRFDLTPLLHGSSLSPLELLTIAAYGLAYTVAILLLAGVRLHRRDLQ